MGCPSGVVVSTAVFKNYADPDTNGNEVFNIPVKEGAPLSTACQRANMIGSIPEVISYAGFTLIDGGVKANKVSNGGIAKAQMATFFNRRGSNQGCFGDIKFYGSVCC
jgi:hypothetical protein